MATEIPIEQLLCALLDAQNQCNALLGEVLERLVRVETDRVKPEHEKANNVKPSHSRWTGGRLKTKSCHASASRA